MNRRQFIKQGSLFIPACMGMTRLVVEAQHGPTQVMVGQKRETDILAPFTYQAIEDTEVRNRPTVTGTPADLTVEGRGAGYVFTDLNYGTKILRVTDANTHVDDGSDPALPNRIFSTPSGSGHSTFNRSGTKFCITNGFGNWLPYSFNEAAMTATRIAPIGAGDTTNPLQLKNEPWFSLVTDDIIYGVDNRATFNNNLRITQYNFATNTFTVICNLADQSLPPVTENNETNNTAGVTSTDALPDEYIGCYWGGGGDYGRYYSVFKKSDPAGTIRTLDCKEFRYRNGTGSWTVITGGNLAAFENPTDTNVSVAAETPTIVTASGSSWSSEIVAGTSIRIGSETRKILSVDSNTQLTVESAFTSVPYSNQAATIVGHTIHSAQFDRTGRYVIIYKAQRSMPTGSASIVSVWDTQTDTFTLANNFTGHAVNGFGTWVNNVGNVSPLQWKLRPLSDVTNGALQKFLVPTEEAHPGVQFNIADHPAWLNASATRPLVPFFAEIYRYGTDNEDLGTRPWKFWHDEIIAVETSLAAQAGQSSRVWRFLHHMSDLKGDSGGASSFHYSPRVQINRQGTILLFTSNWDKTLGDCTGCDPSQAFRTDVFLAKLPTTIPPLANASNPASGSVTSSGATITFDTDLPGDSVVEYGTSLSYGSTAKNPLLKTTGHSVALTGLASGTEYFYRVGSRNRIGLYGTKATGSFTTSEGADFVTDAFAEASSDTTLASHTGAVGATWTSHGDTATYTSTAVVNAAIDRLYGLGTAAYYPSGNPASADYYAQADFHVTDLASVNAAICVRMNISANTMYLLRLNNATTWELRKIVAGVATTLASSTSNVPSVGNARTIRLIISGTTLTVLNNGVQDNNLNATDSAISAAGKPGVRFSGAMTQTTGIHLKNFSAR
jgi:hypothetical protein